MYEYALVDAMYKWTIGISALIHMLNVFRIQELHDRRRTILRDHLCFKDTLKSFFMNISFLLLRLKELVITSRI